MSVPDEVRRIADELRVIAVDGLHWSANDVYHRDRFTRVRAIAARLFAVVDTREADEIEATLFQELTHLSPVPVVDGAVLDDGGRILLIQRADNGLWAMPGGAIEMGETPAEAVVREVREETGYVVEPLEFVGVWDSTICGSINPLQLYIMVLLCRPTAVESATHAAEVLDQGWFARSGLPRLSPGHELRVPAVLRYFDERVTYFDRPRPSR